MIGPFPDSPHHRPPRHPLLRAGVVVHPDDDDPLLRAYFPEGGGGDGDGDRLEATEARARTRSPDAPSRRTHESRLISTTDGHADRRCASALGGTPHCRHLAHQHHHHGLQGSWGNPKCIAPRPVCPRPAVDYQKQDVLGRPEPSSRCLGELGGNARPLDADDNEKASRRNSSWALARRGMSSPKP